MESQVLIDEAYKRADIRENERIDDLDCNGFCIIQNPSCFCFGMDAVLLANFSAGRTNMKVMDLGTGTGVIPLLMCAKGKGAAFTGLEIQEDMADMAMRSVRLNNAEDRINIINGDINNIRELFPQGSFDMVTSNPPYIKETGGLNTPNSALNIARHEIKVDLEGVIGAASYLLGSGGSFNMVHKPFRLPEIIDIMKRFRLEPKRIQLVQPYVDKEPNMVLIEAVKGAKPFCKMLPTLNVYEKDGSYTKRLLEYYGLDHGIA